MTKIVFTVPLWEKDIILIVGGCDKDIIEVAEANKLSAAVLEEIKYDKVAPGNSQGGAYFCLDKGIGILWFPKNKVAKGVIAHEATHTVDKIMEYIGAEKEMEARAYTVEWLVNNLPKMLKTVKK